MSLDLIKSTSVLSHTLVWARHPLVVAVHYFATAMPWNNITPSSSSVIGGSSLQGLLGGFMFIAGCMGTAGFLAGVVFFIFSSSRGVMTAGQQGHRWLGGAIIGSALLGGTGLIMGWAWAFGQALH